METKSSAYIATGLTGETLEVTFSASGSKLEHAVSVPAGTRCVKLDAGANPWVVDDYSFIADKKSILYHDAETRGIRIPVDKIVDIKPVA